MTEEFQENILKFIVTKEGKTFLPFLDDKTFDSAEHKLCLELINQYVKKYRVTPKRTDLLEFFNKEAKRQNIKKEIYSALDKSIRQLFEPLEGNAEQIKEGIVEYAQYKSAKAVVTEFAPRLKDGVEVFRDFNRKMTDIIRMSEVHDISEESRHGGFLLQDHASKKHKLTEGHPTFLKGLNKMTAAHGFYTPQLIIIMGGPKAFKTGFVLILAIEYMRDGLNVYYADTENGVNSLRNRMRQALMKLTLQELISGKHDSELDQMVKKLKAMGGDIAFDYFPANKCSMADVDSELEKLKVDKNFVPDLIIYDYLDNFIPEDKRITEKRLMIQAVYHDAIRLQNKRDVFGISPSQVNRNAVNKKVINVKDFAEDFAKAANCHAAFALCRTEEEMEKGLARILPVAQREGVGYKGKNQCLIKLDEERMHIEESDFRAVVEGLKKNAVDE